MKRVPRALLADLRDRWASIVEEDDQTEGFWADVATYFGVNDEHELTEAQRQQALECIRRMALSLRGAA